MANEGSNWGGLLKWSLSHSNGTKSSRNLSEENTPCYVAAMKSQTFDVMKRMKDQITLALHTPEQVLESHGITPQNIEDMLSELQEHVVESIEMANVFCSIGGLVPLLGYLKKSSSHAANIKAKAAEVVNTIVQNNPRNKQFLMHANGLLLLLSSFTSDPDLIVRTKVLGAISSLTMHFDPGVSSAFYLYNGYATLRAALKDALTSESATLKRIALNLTNYLLGKNKSNFAAFSNLGFHGILTKLESSSEDVDIRQAARMYLSDLNPSKIASKAWMKSIKKKRRKYKTKYRIAPF